MQHHASSYRCAAYENQMRNEKWEIFLFKKESVYAMGHRAYQYWSDIHTILGIIIEWSLEKIWAWPLPILGLVNTHLYMAIIWITIYGGRFQA